MCLTNLLRISVFSCLLIPSAVCSQDQFLPSSYITVGEMRETLYRGIGIEFLHGDYKRKWGLQMGFGVRFFQPTQKAFPFTGSKLIGELNGNTAIITYPAEQHIKLYADGWFSVGMFRSFQTSMKGRLSCYSNLNLGTNAFFFTVTSAESSEEKHSYNRLFPALEAGFVYGKPINASWGLILRLAHTLEYLPGVSFLQFTGAGIGLSFDRRYEPDTPQETDSEDKD